MGSSYNYEGYIVEERLNGKFLITYKGRHLRYRQITQRPVKEKKPVALRKAPVQQPRYNPWRKFRLPGSPRFESKEEALAGAL
jgi:hypothetical protein